MKRALLPGLTQLGNTTEILRGLLEELAEDEALWKPSPERWSVAEVLGHLAHVEAHGFRARVDLMLSEDRPVIEPYDQEAFAKAGTYAGDPEDSLDHFEDQRETNLEFLRNLDAGVGSRAGMHQQFGEITINQLLNEWALHDLGHIRQIAELVRAVRYYPNLGPFQSVYELHP